MPNDAVTHMESKWVLDLGSCKIPVYLCCRDLVKIQVQSPLHTEKPTKVICKDRDYSVSN